MITVKLNLLYLRIKLFFNRIFIYSINLLTFGFNTKNKIFIILLLLYTSFQLGLNKLCQNGADKTTNNNETVNYIDQANHFDCYVLKMVNQKNDELVFSICMHQIIYMILILIIAGLIFYKKEFNAKLFPEKKITSRIDLLISKGKIEYALKKLYKIAKQKDELLENEILLLKSELNRYKNDRHNGLLTYDDFQTKVNRIVKRMIDVVDEINLF